MSLSVCNTDVGGKASRDGRKPNAVYRQREHLTEDEIVRLIAAARDNRHGARDAALIFTMYRHGLRVSEARELDWSAVKGRLSTWFSERIHKLFELHNISN